jgi:hypothetical protein
MILSGDVSAKESSRKLSMEKTTQTTRGAEQVNASDKEVWSAVRYLDDEPNDALSLAFVAGAVFLYVIIPALGWLYFG